MEEKAQSFDFRAFGQAIKKARTDNNLTREQLGSMLNISPRYLVDIENIENEGQHPSLQVLYELITYFHISADQFFFPETSESKTTRRRQLDIMLDGNEQYTLELVETTEVRYNDNEEPYDWRVLTVNLTVKPLSEIISELLDEGQLEADDIILVSKGNRQYVGSPFSFEWLPYVSSGYGWRVSPITGVKEFHKGMDIALPEGTEIIAAHNGVVDFVGWDDSYGNYVVIAGNGGIVTKYAHCLSLLVTEGQTRNTIALVGSTGDSTGNHLHYEVLKNNRNLNPAFFALTK